MTPNQQRLLAIVQQATERTTPLTPAEREHHLRVLYPKARTTLKRALVTGYTRRLVPKWLVTLAFRLIDLRSS